MKKFAALTISLCISACITAGISAETAAADTQQPYYPLNFTVDFFDGNSDISDYAIDGDVYAFADSNIITVIENQIKTVYDIGEGFTVTALDCSDGKFFYKNNNGSVFSLPDNDEENHQFPSQTNFKETDEGEYKLLPDGSVHFCPKDSVTYVEVTGAEGDYSLLKEYGGQVYAINSCKLYRMAGASAEAITLKYTDYSPVNSIPVGNTAEKIKTANNPPRFVKLADGAYMTEIDANDINTVFKTGETYKVGENIKNRTALLLCTAGGNEVSVVMLDRKCYIMNSANAEIFTRDGSVSPSDFNGATVTIPDGYIYSSPYVCESTKLIPLESGAKIKVTGSISNIANPELTREFYLAEYKDAETEKVTVGYIPKNHVSPYTYIENDPGTTKDPNYTEEDYVKPVVLVLLVVVLVLCAVGYMLYAGTSNKNKKKKKNKQNENKE